MFGVSRHCSKKCLIMSLHTAILIDTYLKRKVKISGKLFYFSKKMYSEVNF